MQAKPTHPRLCSCFALQICAGAAVARSAHHHITCVAARGHVCGKNIPRYDWEYLFGDVKPRAVSYCTHTCTSSLQLLLSIPDLDFLMLFKAHAPIRYLCFLEGALCPFPMEDLVYASQARTSACSILSCACCFQTGMSAVPSPSHHATAALRPLWCVALNV